MRRTTISDLLLVSLLMTAGASRADYIDHFATRADVGLYKAPSTGATKVLVIPVFVDDQPYSAGSEAAFVAEINDFFADDDRSVFDGGFRFSPYWEQASLGRFRPSAVVAAPVHFPTCPPLGDNEGCEIPRGGGFADGDTVAAINTLTDAMRFLDQVFLCATDGPAEGRGCTSGGGVDLHDVDVSGGDEGSPDGFVDGVIIVSNAAFPGIALPVKDLSQQQLLRLFGPFPSFQYSGGDGVEPVTIAAVGIAGSATKPQRETFVAVHEFGHLLGFADLYNEAGTTTDLPYSLMGGWYYDSAASLLDPFSRVAIGWANVLDVSTSGTFELPSAARSGVVLKVGGGDEFLLVEHRAKHDGILDGDLGVDSGVLIERVRLSRRPGAAPGSYFSTLQDCVDCNAFDAMLTIEEADGDYGLQRGLARDDGDDLFAAGEALAPSTNTRARAATNAVGSSNLLSGAATGITITVDSSDDDGARVRVELPARAAGCADLEAFCTGPCSVDDDDNGRCGDFATFPAVPPTPVGDGDGNGDGDNDDVGCGAVPTTALSGLAFVLALRRRRRG